MENQEQKLIIKATESCMEVDSACTLPFVAYIMAKLAHSSVKRFASATSSSYEEAFEHFMGIFNLTVETTREEEAE